MSTRFGGIPIVFRMFQRELRSRELKFSDGTIVFHLFTEASQVIEPPADRPGRLDVQHL